MNCRIAIFVALLLIVSPAAQAQHATRAEPVTPEKPVAAAPLRTWAVLLSDDLRTPALEDQVLAALGDEAGITLVNRERLDLLARELALEELGNALATARRVTAGRILRADALVVLSRDPTAGKGFVRLTICECRTGARLHVGSVDLAEGKADEAAAKILSDIRRTRTRFANGVTRVYGVLPFVSRCLTHRYDYLQKGYAELLAAGLSAVPGMAVIEIEEARRIARELALRGDADLARSVPVFVEGEFEVPHSATEQQAAVTLRVSVRDATGGPRPLPERTMRFSQAVRYVSTELPALVAGLHGPTGGESLGPDEQAKVLLARAKAFAALGAWDQSTGLREAALLLKDDAAERRKVLQEYCRIAWAPWPPGARGGNEIQLTECRRRVALWKTALAHIEYLVRNRQVNLPQAVAHADEAFQNILQVRCSTSTPPKAKILAGIEQVKRRFIPDVFPLMLSLDHASPHKSGRQEELCTWSERLFEHALLDYRSNSYRPDTLDFIAAVTTKVLPGDFRPPDRLAYFMTHSRQILKKSPDLSEDAWMAFLDKLIRSDRPAASLAGRYGKLYHQFYFKRGAADLAELHTEAKRLVKDYREQSPRMRGRSGSGILSARVGGICGQIGKALQPATPRPDHAAARPPRPKPPRPESPVALEPIQLSVKTSSGDLVPFKKRWGGLKHLDIGGNGVDVFWRNDGVAVMRRKGALEEVLVDRTIRILDVAFDGRDLWVATREKGLWVVSLDGCVAYRIGQAEGLPAGERGMRLNSIGPGKVLAAGAFGPHERLWLAVVSHDADGPRVNVFHRGTRVLIAGQRWKKAKPDIDRAGAPLWMHELQYGDKGTRRTVVLAWGRRCMQPMQVDLETLEVSLYGGLKSMAWLYSDNSVHSCNGRLHKFTGDGCVLPLGNRLYATAGGVWYQIDVTTGHAVHQGRLPRASGIRKFGVSSYYGLVCWHQNGSFYRLIVKAEEAPADPGPPAESPQKGPP